MSRSRFIGPGRAFKHVELDEGDWVNIKTKLNYGESAQLWDATYSSDVGGDSAGKTTREMKMSQYSIRRILLYVMEWSFRDENNRVVPITATSIGQLDSETAQAIHDAINEVEREREEDEKLPKPEMSTQPSPSSGAQPTGLSLVPAGNTPPEKSEPKTT